MSKLGLAAVAIQAVLGALVALEVIELSAEQIGAIMLAVNAILAAVWAWLDPNIPIGSAP